MISFGKPDFVLLHPPSVYDFRKTLRLPSPMADLVPSGTSFEMYPIGFAYLGEFLQRNGIDTRIVNLATMMLERPGLDVEKLIKSLRPLAFGISFHWLPHCHGALEIARLCKEIHPDIPVIMGGYSATIFHRQLIKYPQVDYVLRGDSTEVPLKELILALAGDADTLDVPNLTFLDGETGEPVENPLTYVPADLDHLGNCYRYMLRSAVRYLDVRGLRAFKGWWSYPLTAIMTCRGCLYDCNFCGGSALSMGTCFDRQGVAFRSPESIRADVEVISSFTGAPMFVIGDLRQGGDEYADLVLEAIGRVRPPNHIVLELFEPAGELFLTRAASRLTNFDIEISPESHDEEIRSATGKRYSNLELEKTIACALGSGCGRVDVFFMIGLPGQTPGSVMDTVAYCGELLDKFGSRVNPMIGPLAPFIDPGSAFRQKAREYGYRLLLHSLEDYRQAVTKPHWRDVLGYETLWMSRQEIVDTTYEAILGLNRLKGRYGVISPDHMEGAERLLKENIELLDRLDRSALIEGARAREIELEEMEKRADSLFARADILKEELKWPVEGGNFHYLNIARLVLADCFRRPGGRRRHS